MLDSTEDDRVGPLNHSFVRSILLNGPISQDVIKPDDGLEFVLEMKRSTIPRVAGEGAETR